MQALNVAILVEWIMASRLVAPALRLVLVAVVLRVCVPSVPRCCSLDRSMQAIAALSQGIEPVRPPLGSEFVFHEATHYHWRDYRAVLSYLRTQTDSKTRVAGFLRCTPFPPVNGPSGRLTAFPAAGGVLWLKWLGPGDEDRFAEALERTPNSVVVWMPDEGWIEKKLVLPRLSRTIERLYEPAVRFESMQIWTRKGQAECLRSEQASR
jgi:hypothetical protein